MEEVNIHSAASGKAGDISSFCASCGIAKGDVLKLMTCTACKLVRYCSVACQKHHRPQHKQACKKRMAELRDDLLFTQPESSCYGDCPICCLPMPIDTSDFSVMSCCCKSICDGCFYADMPRQLNGSQKQAVCLYCRHPLPETEAEFDKNKARRAEANDPAALRAMGHIYYLKGAYTKASHYWTKSAGLGDAISHFELSLMFWKGEGVEKDEKKRVFHLEEAAIAGHPDCRYNLGLIEWNDGNFERAVKHFIIAATLGQEDSVQILKEGYEWGIVDKDDFAAALRAHQAAVDEMKSPQREAAAKLRKNY